MTTRHLMKRNWILVALVTFCVSSSVWAAGPGTDGGNAFSSKPEDVEAVVAKLKNEILFGLVSEAQTRQLLNPKYAQDDDIKKILNAFFGNTADGNFVGNASGVGLLSDALQSTYVPRPHCRVGGESKDAATAKRRGAPICFSTKRLSRFPKDQLEMEVATLAFHELAHHFGFEEEAAYKFQNYMREFVKNFFQLRVISAPNMKFMEMRPRGIVKIKSKNGTKRIRCLADEMRRDLSALQLGDDAYTFLLSGQSILTGSLDGPVGVSCRHYPPVDCADWPYLDEKHEETSLRHLQMAGVCKKDVNKGKAPDDESDLGVSAK